MSSNRGTIRTCLLAVFLCLQICSLEGRLLRVARQAAVVSDLDENELPGTVTNSPDITTTQSTQPGHLGNTVPPEPPSCQPSHHQMKYYNGLYDKRSVSSSFNGNLLYYALKAMDVHSNASNSSSAESPTQELPDPKIDPSRYLPSTMPTKNKLVCSKILSEMDQESELFSKTSLCEWEYTCDYKTDRFPHYLFQARCTTDKCKGSCNGVHSHANVCQTHGIHVAVLEKRANCDDWVWGQEMLRVACTCTNKLLMTE